METNNKQIAPEKEYSYLIYIAVCVGVPILIRLAIANTPFNAGDVAFTTAMVFVFCSLAWIIGRKYSLNYALRCIIGGSAFIMPAVIKQFGQMEINESVFMVIFKIATTIVIAIFCTIIVGLVLFAVSYPFQRLFSKFRS